MYSTDHFFRDRLREVCDSCIVEERFLGHEELRSVLLNSSDSDIVFRFFDGLKRNEPRLRWDRLVAIHLLLLAFVNSFGYEMQKSTPQQFVDVALQANNAQVLRNLASWLPKLGLQQNKSAMLIAKAVKALPGSQPRAPQVGTFGPRIDKSRPGQLKP
jgi:hypothetical protein